MWLLVCSDCLGRVVLIVSPVAHCSPFSRTAPPPLAFRSLPSSRFSSAAVDPIIVHALSAASSHVPHSIFTDAVVISSLLLFVVVLFALGSFKGVITGSRWYLTGVTMLVQGSITTILAYVSLCLPGRLRAGSSAHTSAKPRSDRSWRGCCADL